jgi:hypothetical protein
MPSRPNPLLLAPAMILMLSFLPVYAVDLNAEISSKGVQEKPVFRFVETAFVDYHNGGKLQSLLRHKNMTVSFQDNSSNHSIKDMINKINANLAQDKSQTRITDMTIYYKASIAGGDSSATIDYSITLVPTIDNYIMAKNSDGSTVIDAGWIGLSLHGPVTIKTVRYGDVEINQPASFLHMVIPDFEITDPKVQQVLEYDIIDSSTIVQQPVSNWQHMFDPAYIITETSGWGYNGDKIPITTYAIGQSSIGIVQDSIVHTADFTLDKEYEIQTIQHAGSATIQIDGHASLQAIGNEITFTTNPSVNDNLTPASGLSVQTIYAMAGFGAVLAAGIFIWSNKKMKDSIRRGVDNSPPPTFQYEDRKHWADRFDTDANSDEQKVKKSAI